MHGDGRRRLALQPLLVLSQKHVVGVVRVLLHLLAQVVRHPGRHEIHQTRDAVVPHGHVLREEAVSKLVVAAEGLHDEQVMKLVHRLREVHLEVVRPAPEPQRLVQVKHGEEGEVRHARDRLERVEPAVIPPLVQLVDYQHRGVDDERVHEPLQPRHGGVVVEHHARVLVLVAQRRRVVLRDGRAVAVQRRARLMSGRRRRRRGRRPPPREGGEVCQAALFNNGHGDARGSGRGRADGRARGARGRAHRDGHREARSRGRRGRGRGRDASCARVELRASNGLLARGDKNIKHVFCSETDGPICASAVGQFDRLAPSGSGLKANTFGSQRCSKK
eukprot:31278-Pelagococcus_subviridis.AAC.6